MGFKQIMVKKQLSPPVSLKTQSTQRKAGV